MSEYEDAEDRSRAAKPTAPKRGERGRSPRPKRPAGLTRGPLNQTAPAAAGILQRRQGQPPPAATAGTESVHDAAQSGLTGPAQSLPHLAQIQASFGKHDVSGVRAHVGGAAAEASDAIGAAAYATGDRVAFRDTPDLFTAAHEAAHVVQQRRGVHLLGGVGQEGDPYEQHADEVATAVVQGRSAEPLLDQMHGGGGVTSSHGVQRKPVGAIAAPSSGGVAHDQRALGDIGTADRDRVVVTNIVAAQNELEEVLRHLDAAKRPDSQLVTDKLVRADLYLMEAVETLPLANATSSEIAAAIMSFHEAESRIPTISFLDDESSDQALAHARDRVHRREDAIMRRCSVSAGSVTRAAYRPTLGRSKDVGAPEVDALGASLRLAEREAARGFQQLIGEGGDFSTRLAVVQRTAALVEGHVGHASLMMMSQFDDKQRAALRPAIEAASQQILLIKRWIDGRSGNAAMKEAFRSVVFAANGVRARVGLDAVDLDEARGFPERAFEAETKERGDMQAVAGQCVAGFRRLSSEMMSGVMQWFELARREEQHQPSFLASLAIALIKTAAGDLGGLLATKLFEVAEDEEIKGAIQMLLKKGASESSKLFAQPVLDRAIAESAKEPTRPHLKALLYVQGGLTEICSRMEHEHVTKLHEQVAAGELSIPQVKGLETTALKAAKSARDIMSVRAATDWARYVAQSSLTGKREHGAAHPTGKSVSTELTALDGYFGSSFDRDGTGPAERRSREGSAGMLYVFASTFGPDTGRGRILGGPPTINQIHVNGLNREMAELILSDPSVKTLDDVKVPKEVHIKFQVHLGRATYRYPGLVLAIDETGRIRDFTTKPDEGTQPRTRGDVNLWWDMFRRLPISTSLVG